MKKQPLDYASPREPERGGPVGCLIIMSWLGVLSVLLGSVWLYTFLFTDHRPHHRPIMIPVGLFAVVLGGFLIALRVRKPRQ